MPLFLPLQVRPGKPVLRGQDFFWSQIREAGRNGRHFTVSEIDLAGNAGDRRQVHNFMVRLVAAGIAETVGWAETPVSTAYRGTTPARLYRLVKRPHETPRLKRDGTPANVGRTQPMWNAIRALGAFTARELAVTATTEELSVTAVYASKYAGLLARAGYLVIVAGGGKRRRTTWRLKPSMNSGPKAPAVLTAQVVYDPNRGTIVGPVEAEISP